MSALSTKVINANNICSLPAMQKKIKPCLCLIICLFVKLPFNWGRTISSQIDFWGTVLDGVSKV